MLFNVRRTSRHLSSRRPCTLVESCETRLLFAIDVAVGVGVPVRSVMFTDGDGTTVNIRVAGGAATLTFDGPSVTQTTVGSTATVGGTNVEMTNLVMTGSNPNVLIRTTAPGADGRVGLGAMRADGPVGAVTGRDVVLRGTTLLSNGIGKLDVAGVQNATITINRGAQARLLDASLSLGVVQDTSITSQQPLRMLRVGSWAAGSPGQADGVSTLRINSIQSAGDFAADISLSGNGQAVGRPILGNVRILGALTTGSWNVAGRTSRVAAGSVAGNWEGTFGTVSALQVAGDMAGELTAEAINSLTANTITDADIRLTRAFAPRAVALNRLSARGAITDTNIRTTADIGTVSAASMSNSIIFAGVATGGGGGGNRALPNNDADLVNTATIRSVTIRNRTATPAFIDSKIAASTLGRINLGAVQVSNGGEAFGLAAREVRSVSALNGATPIRGARLTEPAQSLDVTDFKVRIF